MTKIDTSGLQAVKSGRKAKEKPEWAPFDFELLHEGMYLACDQSYTASGLVELYVWPDRVEVMQAIRIATDEIPEVSGWESDYRRADDLQQQILRWMHKHRVMLPISWSSSDGRSWKPPSGLVAYVHEAPPIGGGKFVHPEVSLLSGYAFRMAMRELTHHNNWSMSPLPMIRAQDHKNLICGNANADKRVHHAALKKHFIPRIVGSEMITNEATRDALSIALTAAYRGSK